jgi:outer membrane protein OmpA-like peptidoglycan-associated protein
VVSELRAPGRIFSSGLSCATLARVVALRVLEPCHESWSDMPGTPGERHCAACGKDVHDLTAMSSAEATAYVRLRGGASLCVRMLVMSAAVACGGPAKAPQVAPERLAVPAIPVDTDGDGIADADDACPQEPGVPSVDAYRRGCPAPRVVNVVTMGIVIMGQVHFPRATSTLPAETFRLIDQTIELLKLRQEVRRIAIEGHASSDEPDAQRLSEARASSVLERMVAAGIDRTRLVALGEGASKPIADDAAESGRETNRRVEFRVLDASSPSPLPDAASQACAPSGTSKKP